MSFLRHLKAGHLRHVVIGNQNIKILDIFQCLTRRGKTPHRKTIGPKRHRHGFGDKGLIVQNEDAPGRLQQWLGKR